MNKKEVQQRVSQCGSPLPLKLFTWDEKTNTFSSEEDYLVIDFEFIFGCTFKTGDYCTFHTWSNCTFKTGSDCIFKTGQKCTFDTGSSCIFNTWFGCTFKTESNCIFQTSFDCTFYTDWFGCVVIRRDIYEVIELKENQKIRLNTHGVKGFVVIDN